MILLVSWDTNNTPTDDVVLDTIETAFSSIKSLSKQKEVKEPDGIVANRRDVLDMFAHLIGKISEHRFDDVVNRFYRELDSATDSNNIPECCALLSGIRFLRLTYTTNENLEKTKIFLDFISKHINKKSKLDMLTSSCQLYGDILLPLSDCEEIDGINYTQFRESITEMFYNTKKLWKKLKEPTPGLTMEVGILCNGKKEFLAQQPFSVLERLSKLTKSTDKNRAQILECTYYLLMTMFMKYDNSNYDFAFDLILEKVAREMFPSSSKKPIIPQLGSISVYVDIALLISIYRLEYAIKNFVHDCISSNDNNYERILIGLKTFNGICDRVAISFDKTQLHNSNSKYLETMSYRKISLSKFLKSKIPSHLSSENIEKFRCSFEKVFLLVDSQIGDLLLYNQPKYSDFDLLHLKYLPKEKQPLIYILRSCIDCIRRAPPRNIEIENLLNMLSKLTFHIDTEVRLLSRNILIGILKTKPIYRSVLIKIYAKFIVTIPESQSIYIHKAIEILINLLQAWHDPVVLNVVDPDSDLFPIPGNVSEKFPADILEGCSLFLLCNPNSLVRNDALDLLEWTKRVNEGLPREICDSSPAVILLLRENEKQLIDRINIDPTLVSTDEYEPQLNTIQSSSLYNLVNSVNTDELQTSIGRCIGEIVKAINPNCLKALKIGNEFALQRLEYLNSIIINSKRIDSPGFIEQLILWRNYCIIVGGSGPLETDKIARIASALHSPLSIVRESIQYVIYYMNNSSIVDLSNITSDGKRKKDMLRIELSHVCRIISDKKVFDCNDSNVILRSLDFIEDTINYMNSLTDSTTQYNLLFNLSYDLFRSSALLFEYLNKKLQNNNNQYDINILKSTKIRELLFQLSIRYSGFGTYRDEQKIREQKAKDFIFSSLSTTTSSSSSITNNDNITNNNINNNDKIKKEFENLILCMKYWSLRCINSILCYPTEFITSELLSEAGPVFALVTDVFENYNNKKQSNIIKTLVKELIRSNPEKQEFMFRICIDKSFQLSSQKISQGYFITVTDIITSNIDTTCKLPVLLTLAIYKLADTNLQVRKCAVELLHWMSIRFFRVSEYTYKLWRSISVNTSSLNQMINISKSFSNMHPELRFGILQEVLHRIGQVDRVGQRKLIQMIDAWFSGVDISSQFDESCIYEIFQHFCVFTHIHGEHRPDILESLWNGIAKIPKNIDILESFMINNILERQQLNLLQVFRTISIFIIRVNPERFCELLIKELDSPETYGAQIIVDSSRQVAESSATWSFNHNFKIEKVKYPWSRREFAMIIISDCLNENYDVFKKHIPVILTAIFVEMDSNNQQTFQFAKVLLENIIHGYISNEEKENSESYKSMKSLFSWLDNIDINQPFWPNESATIQNFTVESANTLQQVAELVLKSFNNHKNLKHEWAQAAITWAVNDPSIHITERSLQLYRALSPSLNERVLNSLVAKLVQSIQSRSPVNIQISFEIMATLKIVPKSTPRDELIQLPQLFWTASSMLNSVVFSEFICAVELVSALVDQMKVHSEDMQKSLLSTIPQSWSPPFKGIIPFLLKGLCSPKTEEVCRKLLTKISCLPCIYPFHCDKDLRILGNLLGLLPHLLTGMGRVDTLIIAENITIGLSYFGEDKLSQLFKDYTKYTTSAEGMRRFVHEISNIISEKYFPKHEIFVFGLLIEIMEHGPSCHRRSILSLIEVLLSNTNLQESLLNTRYLSVLSPCTKYFSTPQWTEALNVLEVVLEKSSDDSKQKIYKTIPSKDELQKLQENSHTWERNDDSSSLVKALQEALSPSINPNPPELFKPVSVPETEIINRAGTPVSSAPIKEKPILQRANSNPAGKWEGIKPKREISKSALGSSFMGTSRSPVSKRLSLKEETTKSSSNEIKSVERESSPEKRNIPPQRPPRVTRVPSKGYPMPQINSQSVGNSPPPNMIRGPGPPVRGRGNPRGLPRGNPRGSIRGK